MRNDILSLLEGNAKLTPGEIATYLDVPEPAVRNEIAALEAEGVICGYGAFINWGRTESEMLTALIEVKVTPVRGRGFDAVAERIYRFNQVKAVYLMSGGYDLALVVEGKSLKEISFFVSEKLAPLESILSASTHFVLKKYKDHGVVFAERDDDDERVMVCP